MLGVDIYYIIDFKTMRVRTKLFFWRSIFIGLLFILLGLCYLAEVSTYNIRHAAIGNGNAIKVENITRNISKYIQQFVIKHELSGRLHLSSLLNKQQTGHIAEKIVSQKPTCHNLDIYQND